MKELLFQTIAAALGSLAFGIVYREKSIRLPVVAAGGGFSWFLYRVFFYLSGSIFLSNMAAAVFATAFSDVCARKLKAPVIIFLLPCLIPMVPGGGLYYTLSFTLLKELGQAFSYLESTMAAAFGIAAGVVVVSVYPKTRRRAILKRP